jgi:hypothetical protein
MPVAIAGMHRSGTSMVARLLHECGLNLGPVEQLLPGQPDNPEGFWEHPAFVAINDDILKAAGGSWNVLPICQIEGMSDIWRPFRERAGALPAEIGLTEPWGWKDPRTSLTMPFWNAVWSDLRVVVCIRNPMEVAQSLLNRDGYSYLTGLRLWRDYYELLIESIPAERRVVTHYDSFFIDAKSELGRVSDAVGLPQADDRRDAAIAKVIPTLRHTRVSNANFAKFPLPPGVLELYQTLCGEAGPIADRESNVVSFEPSSRMIVRTLLLEEQSEQQVARIADLERELRDREAEIAKRNWEIEHLQGLTADMRRHLDLQHEHLTERCQRVRDLEARLSARRHRYADRMADTLNRARHPFQ